MRRGRNQGFLLVSNVALCNIPQESKCFGHTPVQPPDQNTLLGPARHTLFSPPTPFSWHSSSWISPLPTPTPPFPSHRCCLSYFPASIRAVHCLDAVLRSTGGPSDAAPCSLLCHGLNTHFVLVHWSPVSFQGSESTRGCQVLPQRRDLRGDIWTRQGWDLWVRRQSEAIT